MPDTSLSPRLAHLLIQEDKATGRLIMPDGSDVHDSRFAHLISPISPSPADFSPLQKTFAFEASPLAKATLPSLGSGIDSLRLPPPVGLFDRRAKTRGGTPPGPLRPILSSSPPSSSPRVSESLRLNTAQPISRQISRERESISTPYGSNWSTRPSTSKIPQTAPQRPSWASSFSGFDQTPPVFRGHRPLPTAPAGTGFPGRERDVFRRYSHLPFEGEPFDRHDGPSHHHPHAPYTSHGPPPSPRSHPYHMGPYHYANYTPTRPNYGQMQDPPTSLPSSRAPISRTTKACDACRSRKVRCDAGGAASGADPSDCSRCKEAGVTCVYTGVQKKRGPCPGSIRGSAPKARRTSHRSSLASTDSGALSAESAPDSELPHASSSYPTFSPYAPERRRSVDDSPFRERFPSRSSDEAPSVSAGFGGWSASRDLPQSTARSTTEDREGDFQDRPVSEPRRIMNFHESSVGRGSSSGQSGPSGLSLSRPRELAPQIPRQSVQGELDRSRSLMREEKSRSNSSVGTADKTQDVEMSPRASSSGATLRIAISRKELYYDDGE